MFGANVFEAGISASIIAALISTAGITAAAVRSDWARDKIGSISAFAVGMLTYAVLFHLLLESFASSPLAIAWVLAGFAGMVVIGVAAQFAVNQSSDGPAIVFGYASIFALGIHSFVDGFIYASVFQNDIFTGWFSVIGLMLHEFPEGVIVFSLVIAAGLGGIRAIAVAILTASITTVVGAIVGRAILQFGISPPEYVLLATVAGALIFVLLIQLMPHAAKAPNKSGYLWAMAGVTVASTAHIITAITGGH